MKNFYSNIILGVLVILTILLYFFTYQVEETLLTSDVTLEPGKVYRIATFECQCFSNDYHSYLVSDTVYLQSSNGYAAFNLTNKQLRTLEENEYELLVFENDVISPDDELRQRYNIGSVILDINTGKPLPRTNGTRFGFGAEALTDEYKVSARNSKGRTWISITELKTGKYVRFFRGWGRDITSVTVQKPYIMWREIEHDGFFVQRAQREHYYVLALY